MGQKAAIPINEEHVDEAIAHHQGRASIVQITERVIEKERHRLDTGNLSDHTVLQLVKTRVNAVLKTGRTHGRYSSTNGIWKRLEKAN